MLKRTQEGIEESVSTEEELNVSTPENQESESALDFNDPATWPDSCDDILWVSLVQHSPHQEKDIDFPLDIGRRRFSKNHFKRQTALIY